MDASTLGDAQSPFCLFKDSSPALPTFALPGGNWPLRMTLPSPSIAEWLPGQLGQRQVLAGNERE